jgi:hypothetical protein
VIFKKRYRLDTADAGGAKRGLPGPPPISLAPLSIDERLKAVLETPPANDKDEIAGRLTRDSKALVKKSRKLIEASKQKIKRR